MFTSDTAADTVLRVLLLGPVALVWVIVLVRVIGLRSFSKLTAFDFVVTLATGSLLATAASASGWQAYAQAIGAMASLLAAQMVLAWLRRRSDRVRGLVENDPVLIAHEGRMLHGAMRRNRIAEADINSKMREADVRDLSQVRAIVLETTGDITVLTGDRPHAVLSDVGGPAAEAGPESAAP
jgi:uncharacterized membrane protein YcaP (DUF421 family)